VIEVAPEGLKVIDMVEGLTFEELQKRTGATLIDARA
jgi:3-oxoadipate CoA-transferase beta subunit